MRDDISWLPADFVHPERVELPTGHHIRPIRARDVALDYPAVMGSQARLFTIFGPPWNWPPPTLTLDEDRVDLARHEREQNEHQSFNYAMFDTDETRLLGCIYIDPTDKPGADADISWWVVDEEVGGALDHALDAFVPHWLTTAWPFARPRLIGRDLTWAQWLALAGPSENDKLL